MFDMSLEGAARFLNGESIQSQEAQRRADEDVPDYATVVRKRDGTIYWNGEIQNASLEFEDDGTAWIGDVHVVVLEPEPDGYRWSEDANPETAAEAWQSSCEEALDDIADEQEALAEEFPLIAAVPVQRDPEPPTVKELRAYFPSAKVTGEDNE